MEVNDWIGVLCVISAFIAGMGFYAALLDVHRRAKRDQGEHPSPAELNTMDCEGGQ